MDTTFKTDLYQKLLAKPLAESSVKLYIRNLEKLNDNKPLKNLNFLKNCEATVEKLNKYKENTKRNYLISICSVLGLDKTSKPKQKLYDCYFKAMIEKNNQIKEVDATNTKSETQEKNWVEWSDILEIHSNLKKQIEGFGKKISEAEYDILLQYIVLSLYVLQPPRRNADYQFMEIVKKLPSDQTKNYLDIEKNEMTFNKFKTVRKDGSLTIPVNEPLMEAVKLYMKYHPLNKKKFEPIPFLVYYNGEPLKAVNSMTRILNSTFKPKKIGSSMLRHAYLSSKYGKELEEKKQDAMMMSHTVATAQGYIKN